MNTARRVLKERGRKIAFREGGVKTLTALPHEIIYLQMELSEWREEKKVLAFEFDLLLLYWIHSMFFLFSVSQPNKMNDECQCKDGDVVKRIYITNYNSCVNYIISLFFFFFCESSKPPVVRYPRWVLRFHERKQCCSLPT